MIRPDGDQPDGRATRDPAAGPPSPDAAPARARAVRRPDPVGGGLLRAAGRVRSGGAAGGDGDRGADRGGSYGSGAGRRRPGEPPDGRRRSDPDLDRRPRLPHGWLRGRPDGTLHGWRQGLAVWVLSVLM